MGGVSVLEVTEDLTQGIELSHGVEPLTLRDRCDRCGAQAFVRAFLKDSDLLFCGHHYARYEMALATVVDRVQDERERINEKPSVSANSE